MTTRIILLLLVTVSIATAVPGQTFPAPTARGGYLINTYHGPLMDSPTAITVDPLGRVYCVTYQGIILVLDDTDLDGVADFSQTFFNGSSVFLPPCTGITWHNNSLYVSHRGTISRVDDIDGDLVADNYTDLITGLPVGLHQNNNIVFDDQNNMYFSLGSTVDLGVESDPWSATVMKADDSGGNLQVYATGLRNTYGLYFTHGGLLLGGDNGHNVSTVNPIPFDEINVIRSGTDYGYPNYDGFPPANSGTADPVMLLGSHAGPTGGDGDQARLFSGFENDAYVCLIATAAGSVARISVFEHPILADKYDGFTAVIGSNFTSAVDCKVATDGALLVADFQTRKIERITAEDYSRIRINGGPFLGLGMNVTIEAPNDPLNFCLVCFSDSDSPAVTLPDGRLFHVNVSSPVFSFSIFRDANGFNPVNQFGQFGTAIDFTDAAGICVGDLWIPDLPSIVGTRLYLAAIGGDSNQNVTFATASLPFEILQ